MKFLIFTSNKHLQVQQCALAQCLVCFQIYVKILQTVLEKYGFYEVKQKKMGESEFPDYEEPLHVEGMEPKWQDLNKKFFDKHKLINQYNPDKKIYETNFVLTGFDRDPSTSLIVEAKKEKDVDSIQIKDVRNYNYSQSIFDNKKFQKKYENIRKVSTQIDKEEE